MGIDGGEGAALEQHAHDRLGGKEERDGRGQGEEQSEFERAVLARQHGVMIAGSELVAERGQQHDADGDADHP